MGLLEGYLMEKYDKFEFSECVRVLEHENRVILGNSDTGKWLKLSRECFNALKKCEEKALILKEVEGVFADEEDKNYMQGVITTLDQLGILGRKPDISYVPKAVTFAITNRCNLRCSHCCVEAGAGDEEMDLSPEDCRKIVYQIASLQPEEIVFTGGEPFIRKDFLDLLSYTASIFKGNIGIMTNGTLINRQTVKTILPLVHSMDISIDGVDEASCSAVRGSGVFDKVRDNVKWLQENGFKNISLSMVATRENKKNIDKFYQLNEEMGTKPMVRAFSPLGRGLDNRESLQAERNRGISEEDEVDRKEFFTICACGALKKVFYINYRGEILPCPVLTKEEYSFGKVLEIENMLEFFRTKAYKEKPAFERLETLQPQKFAGCESCNVNLFCWSCLHHLDLCRNGLIQRGGNCQLRKKQIQKFVWE